MFELFTTEAAAGPVEFIGRCARGHVTTATAAGYRAGWIACPCGSRAMAKTLRASNNNNTRCDRRCTGATGNDCECSCVGANHGADHVFTP